MSKQPTKASIEKKHEASARRLVKKLKEDPEWKSIHYILEAKDNPLVQAMNEVFAKAAKRKIN